MTPTPPNPDLTLPLTIVAAALDKKAEDIVLLDLRGISEVADFFVIASGLSVPQIKAVTSEVRVQVREKLGRKTLGDDGVAADQWMVLDYGEVMFHLFYPTIRGYYDLESLWGDAKVVDWKPLLEKA